MELIHQPGEIIAKRYRILNTLGQGGVGITYQAQDLQSGQRVALKALSLHRMADWKVLELFERESKILAQLDHQGIPRYLDYFQVDTDTDRGFYLVQELVAGASLAAWLENDRWHPNEAEVRHVATEVLEILIYLQALTPPIIHRDIKPQNIIRRKDERIFLVDFGAVQDIYHHTVTGGSTVVGTYGYMAPEQFRGQAVLSTDLYGLGTTLLFLLTEKSPAELPQRKLKIDFRPHIDISEEFANWLEKMLEPTIEDRFSSAKQALAVLRGEQALIGSGSPKPRRPKTTPIRLTKTENYLVVDIPPVWLRSDRSRLFALLTLSWNGCLIVLLWLVAESGYVVSNSSNWFLLNGLGLIGLSMLVTLLFSAASSTRLEIEQQNFWLEQQFLLGCCYEKIQGRTGDINKFKLNGVSVCLSRKSWRKHYFGLFLPKPEQEWLVWEIETFLKKLRS